MPYRYLEDETTADVAFESSGTTLEELFVSAADAVLNVMVNDPETVSCSKKLNITLKSETPEMLLFRFIENLIYYKDAKHLLLRIRKISIKQNTRGFTLKALAGGEKPDAHKHTFLVDIKGITLHHFSVKRTRAGWKATVILDV